MNDTPYYPSQETTTVGTIMAIRTYVRKFSEGKWYKIYVAVQSDYPGQSINEVEYLLRIKAHLAYHLHKCYEGDRDSQIDELQIPEEQRLREHYVITRNSKPNNP